MSFKKEKSSALLPCQEQKCLENTTTLLCENQNQTML